MKRLLTATSLFAIAIAIMFGMSSCTQNGTTPSGDIFNQTLFMSAGDYIDNIQYLEASLEKGPVLLNEVTTEKIQNGMLFGGKEPMLPLGQILRQLKLTPEQVEQVKAIMLVNRDCQRAARVAFHQALQAQFEAAALARQEVKAKLDAGEITPEQARLDIRAINDRLKEAIKASGELEKLQAALKICNDEMLRAIKGILTPEQNERFQKWLEMMKDRKGSGGTGGFVPVRP